MQSSLGSSDKAEVFHQLALANQDLMVLFHHHHCQQTKACTDMCQLWPNQAGVGITVKSVLGTWET